MKKMEPTTTTASSPASGGDGLGSSNKNNTRTVVIVGAGPAGLLTALQLLHRNGKKEETRGGAKMKQRRTGGVQQQHHSMVKNHVILIDTDRDYGTLNPQTDLHSTNSKHRSWMINLAGHGLRSIREIPNLYEDYIRNVGIKLEAFTVHFSAGRQISTPTDTTLGSDTESYVIDRNYCVAALARYLHDHYGGAAGAGGSTTTSHHHRHGGDDRDDGDIREGVVGEDEECCYLEMRYHTKVLFVDDERRRVYVRGRRRGLRGSTTSNNKEGHEDPKEEQEEEEEWYIPYDLLVGCDGLRSVVRESIVRTHREFECDVGDIFENFKAVHVERHPSVNDKAIHLLPSCLPSMKGIAIPETGGMMCISIGASRNVFDEKVPHEMKSDDPAIVAEYMKEHFHALPLVDYDDFANRWVSCGKNKRSAGGCGGWNRTGQVHCNVYHSVPLRAVIMGDAAHATSPSIGMGMNTAFADASALGRLLEEHDRRRRHDDDDGDDGHQRCSRNDRNVVRALKSFSRERVKEGNALTDLAMHLNCVSDGYMLLETAHTIIRAILSTVLPNGWVYKHPQQVIGWPNIELSDVYDHSSVTLGIIGRHRYINDKVRREYFERKVGMVKRRDRGEYNPITASSPPRDSLTTENLTWSVKVIYLALLSTVVVGYWSKRHDHQQES